MTGPFLVAPRGWHNAPLTLWNGEGTRIADQPDGCPTETFLALCESFANAEGDKLVVDTPGGYDHA